eukprot:CAMPEP_0182427562 /NCGR_PEP_ID=MMETSP1167-20130531/18443_1 /TAXON_ID=2988 /ORGANISM="Mallomonas Sp, Strain CCMP3275" /LENGTH=541 /DNA_ID=CAMNT_0024609879 /DNA_START=84 /DNA_END=1709 /DNA_ORIENTATION=+
MMGDNYNIEILDKLEEEIKTEKTDTKSGDAKVEPKIIWTSKFAESLQLTPGDQEVLHRFVEAARERVIKFGVHDENWKPQSVAIDANIQVPVSVLPKNLQQAIWIEFLEVMRENISADELKYKNLDEFLDAYSSQPFTSYPQNEKVKLMNTANWMNILFSMEKAKKNKGLVMDVIPRLVEGPNARYVTGSGQTHATADRVLIYEVEGGISPIVRGKRRKGKYLETTPTPHRAAKKVGVKLSHKKRKSNFTPHRRVISRTMGEKGSVNMLSPDTTTLTTEIKQDEEYYQLNPNPDNLEQVASLDTTRLRERPTLDTKPSGSDNGFVTWSVDLNHFDLGPENGFSKCIGRDRSESIMVDFTDGAEDSDEHDDTTSVMTTDRKQDIEVENDAWLCEDFRPERPNSAANNESGTSLEYWDGLNRSNSNTESSLCNKDSEESMPVLLRQPTDRCALMELLEEVGGADNPVALDKELDPMMFMEISPQDMSSPGRGNKKRQSRVSPMAPLSRDLSWGGSLSRMESLPGFPAPHMSYHSDLPDVQDSV